MLGTKVWGGTAASINGWHRPADDRTQQIHGWHKQMNPATQCNVNHHKQQQTSNSLWNWLDQVNLRQLLIEYDIFFCQKPLLALKISLRNFFTTLLEGTRLLSSLPYPTRNWKTTTRWGPLLIIALFVGSSWKFRPHHGYIIHVCINDFNKSNNV